MIEIGIQKRLVADPALSALVATRIYPLVYPDEPVLPAVTYQRISTVRSYTTTGPVSLSQVRLQFDSWSTSYLETKSADAAIRACLENFSGLLPDGTYVDSIRLDSSSDLYDSVARYHRVSTDFILFANE